METRGRGHADATLFPLMDMGSLAQSSKKSDPILPIETAALPRPMAWSPGPESPGGSQRSDPDGDPAPGRPPAGRRGQDLDRSPGSSPPPGPGRQGPYNPPP